MVENGSVPMTRYSVHPQALSFILSETAIIVPKEGIDDDLLSHQWQVHLFSELKRKDFIF